MTEQQPQPDTRREKMFTGYNLSPDLLAIELEILFEPCTDANFAVLHNKAIDLIRTLCGRNLTETDDVGIVTKAAYVLDCKPQLAGHLARTVLGYARRQA